MELFQIIILTHQNQNLVFVNRLLDLKYNVGFAFDGDDRLGVIDDKGRAISGDKLLLLLQKKFEINKMQIIADVKCSQVLFDEVERLGARYLCKTGHSH